jgi:hypothetical protein
VLSGLPNHVSITGLRAAPTRQVANASSPKNKDNSQDSARVVGIDLGTTNSAIAVSFYSMFTLPAYLFPLKSSVFPFILKSVSFKPNTHLNSNTCICR